MSDESKVVSLADRYPSKFARSPGEVFLTDQTPSLNPVIDFQSRRFARYLNPELTFKDFQLRLLSCPHLILDSTQYAQKVAEATNHLREGASPFSLNTANYVMTPEIELLLAFFAAQTSIPQAGPLYYASHDLADINDWLEQPDQSKASFRTLAYWDFLNSEQGDYHRVLSDGGFDLRPQIATRIIRRRWRGELVRTVANMDRIYVTSQNGHPYLDIVKARYNSSIKKVSNYPLPLANE